VAPDPRSSGLPTQEQVIAVLDGEFARAGYEIEDVVIDGSTRPPRITVIADADGGVSLDAIADLSRTASELLDRLDPDTGHGADAEYVLEVTSRGVERPLVAEKHFRRAQGRKVEVTLADGSQVTGRLGETAAGLVRLIVREGNRPTLSVRELPLDGITKAVVQVEFSAPNSRELELAGQPRKEGVE
jgi:ribosome maturation factor RimP